MLLHKHAVRYVIIGGEAVIFYGYARLTGDVDIFYDLQPDNTGKLHAALREFWEGAIPAIEGEEDLQERGLILQFGRPPNRLDLVNVISGVSFQEAWSSRLEVLLEAEGGNVPIFYLGLAHLVANKEAAARPKDLDDLAFLRQALRRNP